MITPSKSFTVQVGTLAFWATEDELRQLRDELNSFLPHAALPPVTYVPGYGGDTGNPVYPNLPVTVAASDGGAIVTADGAGIAVGEAAP